MKNEEGNGPDGNSYGILNSCFPAVGALTVSGFDQRILYQTFSLISTIDKFLLHKKGDKSNPEIYRPLSLFD